MDQATASLPFPATASLLFTDVLTEFQNDKRDKSYSRQENLRYGLRHLEHYFHLHGLKLLGQTTHHALRGYKLYLKGRGLSAVSVKRLPHDCEDVLHVVRATGAPRKQPHVTLGSHS